MIAVENLIRPHNSHQILRLRQIDDVMGVPRQHMYRLDLFAAYLKLQHFVCANLPLLNQAMAANHNEELPLAVVPVLSLRDARL